MFIYPYEVSGRLSSTWLISETDFSGANVATADFRVFFPMVEDKVTGTNVYATVGRRGRTIFDNDQQRTLDLLKRYYRILTV